MYKQGKTLVYAALVCGAFTFGTASPAQSFPSIIPTDGKITKIEQGEFEYKLQDGKTVQVFMTTKTLENGIVLQEIDENADGTIDSKVTTKMTPDVLIQEVDAGANGNIELRGSLYKDGTRKLESENPDGSIDIYFFEPQIPSEPEEIIQEKKEFHI